MKKTKRVFALILALAMALSLLAGCGSKEPVSEDAESSAEGGYAEKVVIASLNDLDSANPYGSTSSMCQWYTNNTHDFLIKSDYNTGELVGVLADKWEDAGEGTAWRVFLKQGVTFHNGDTFNADDVEFTWNWAKDVNNVVKPISNAEAMVKEVVVEDEYTVRFDLNYCIPDFPAYLEVKMLDKEAFDTMSPDEAAVIGTGPYMKGELVSGVSFSLERYDGYWGGLEDHPTKTIELSYVPDSQTIAAMLQSGEADFTFEVNVDNISTLMNDANLEMFSADGCQSYYLGFNYRIEKWNDFNLRKAIACAIDRDEIVAMQFDGGNTGSANYNFCPPCGKGYVEVDYVKKDVELAKQLIKDGGYEGMELVIMSTPGFKAMAETTQAQLMAVGLNPSITYVDGTNWTTVKSTSNDYDITVSDYGTYAGALLYNFNRFFAIDGTSNMMGLNAPEYDAMKAEIEKVTTYDEMLSQFAGMQKWAAEELPLLPLAVNKMYMCGVNGIGGVKVAPSLNLMEFDTLYKLA